MKTKFYIVAVMLGLTLFSTQASAQMMHGGKSNEMPMDSSVMHGRMHEMAELMHSMAEAMHKGKMTSGEQVECAAFMKRLGNLMSDASKGTSAQAEKRHADELSQLKKDWNYWRDEHEDH